MESLQRVKPLNHQPDVYDFLRTVSMVKAENYKALVRRLVAEKRCAAIFCAYDDPGLGTAVLKSFAEEGYPIRYWYTLPEFHPDIDIPDVEILDIDELPRRQAQGEELPEIMIVCETGWQFTMEKYIWQFGISTIRLVGDMAGYERAYNQFFAHLDEIYRTYDGMADAESRVGYLSYLLGRLSRRTQDFYLAPETQYYYPGFGPEKGDIVIDGGAYDGGTALAFEQAGAEHVFAFEMDADNFVRCRERLAGHKAVVENMGLSDAVRADRYMAMDTGSHQDVSGEAIARFMTIDMYVRLKKLKRVDFIKFDIEGAELAALHGAAQTIRRWKPRLALSAYHRYEDIWTLAQYLRELRPDYELAFRHYEVDTTDYWLGPAEHRIMDRYGLDYKIPASWEAVLYAR